MGIEALLSTQIIDTTTVGRAVMTAADAAAARTAISAAATSHTHAASDITSGTIATARLASGTADATTYLRGDQTWQTIAAGGISSLNTLTTATQTFATGTTGTDFAISSATGVHTFNLPDASTTARGVLTTGTQSIAGIKTFTAADIRGGTTQTFRAYIASSQFILNTNLSVMAFSNSAGQLFELYTTSPEARFTANLRFGQFGSQVDFTPDAADVHAQRRGTVAQTSRLYNTYTSATSYERLGITWATNVCTIETEKGSAGGTLRGLRIGGSSSALVGLWGATPIVQPTTAVAAATRVGGGGTAVTDTDTFGGYTIGQIVAAMKNIGALA